MNTTKKSFLKTILLSKDQNLVNAIENFKETSDEDTLIKNLSEIQKHNNDLMSDNSMSIVDTNLHSSILSSDLQSLDPDPDFDNNSSFYNADNQTFRNTSQSFRYQNNEKSSKAITSYKEKSNEGSPILNKRFSFQDKKNILKPKEDNINKPLFLEEKIENEYNQNDSVINQSFNKTNNNVKINRVKNKELSYVFNKNLKKQESICSKENIQEMESPIFNELRRHHKKSIKKNDVMSSVQINELFNEYVHNKNERKIRDKTTYMELSIRTCLRYLSLKDVLNELEETYVSNNNKMTKNKFVHGIFSLLKIHGFNSNSAIENLEGLYDIIKGLKQRLTLEELAGCLSVLCSGSSEERIKTALLYIGAKDGKASFVVIRSYLSSLYRLLLQSEALKADNVTVEELGEATARRCFEDNNCVGRILSTDFIRWFSSQTKTLTPQYHASNVSKAEEIEIKVEKIESIEDIISESIEFDNYGERQLQSPNSEISEDNIKLSPKSILSDPKIMEQQWKEFLSNYYQTYGFYPPPPPSLWKPPTKKESMINSYITNSRNTHKGTYYRPNITLNNDHELLKTYTEINPITSTRTCRNLFPKEITYTSFRQGYNY